MDDNIFQLDILDDQEIPKTEMQKYGFRIFISDWEWLKDLVKYKILKTEDLEFNNSKAISEGISLLNDKNGDIQPRKKNIRYRPGRRDNPGELKMTSTYITKDEVEYLKNYHFHTIFNKGNLEYSQMELFSELVNLMKIKYKGKF